MKKKIRRVLRIKQAAEAAAEALRRSEEEPLAAGEALPAVRPDSSNTE